MPSPKVFVSAVLNITCCYSHTLTTIGKKADLSYIKRGMVLGAKCTGLSISETIVNVNALRKKCLVGARCQRRTARLLQSVRTQIMPASMQKRISEDAMHQTIKQMSYSSRTTPDATPFS